MPADKIAARYTCGAGHEVTVLDRGKDTAAPTECPHARCGEALTQTGRKK